MLYGVAVGERLERPPLTLKVPGSRELVRRIFQKNFLTQQEMVTRPSRL